MPESMLARIEIPASLRFLNPAADFIRSVGDDVGLDDAELNDLQLAFEEILVNTIVHGLSEDPKERIEISCERLLSGVEIMIRDKGYPLIRKEFRITPRNRPWRADWMAWARTWRNAHWMIFPIFTWEKKET